MPAPIPFLLAAAHVGSKIAKASKYFPSIGSAVTAAELSLTTKTAKAPTRKNKNKSIFAKGNMK
tara:strand:- start:1 stop:192 length:192 start_codon:yes stop_codon:yes gene_type:complete